MPSFKIRYGTTSRSRAMIFAWCAFGAAFFPMWTLAIISGCHHSLEQNNMSNGTPSELPNQCHFSYETCLCDTLPNTTHASKNCITRLELHSSHILPPISYVLQVLLIRELFSLSADCDRGLLYMVWTACPLIVVGIILGAYWSNCFSFIIMSCIFVNSDLLLMLWFRDLTRERAPRNRHAPDNILLETRRLQSIEYHVRPPHEIVCSNCGHAQLVEP